MIGGQSLQVVAVSIHMDGGDHVGAGVEVGAHLEGLHAELSVLHTVVEDNISVTGVRGDAGAPNVAQFIENQAVVGVDNGTNMGIFQGSEILVLFQFVKIGREHRYTSL